MTQTVTIENIRTASTVKNGEVVDDITLKVVAKGPARYVREAHFHGLRALALAEDATGIIRVDLTGREASEVEEGDKIRIVTGICHAQHGDRVLSTGPFGWLQVLEDAWGNPTD